MSETIDKKVIQGKILKREFDKLVNRQDVRSTLSCIRSNIKDQDKKDEFLTNLYFQNQSNFCRTFTWRSKAAGSKRTASYGI